MEDNIQHERKIYAFSEPDRVGPGIWQYFMENSNSNFQHERKIHSVYKPELLEPEIWQYFMENSNSGYDKINSEYCNVRQFNRKETISDHSITSSNDFNEIFHLV